MSTMFFHDDEAISSDAAVDRAAPVCEACQRQMWLTKVQTKVLPERADSVREYKCNICGTSSFVESKRDIAAVVPHS